MQVAVADDAHSALLTQAPEVAMISFTGSAAVGHRIRAQAAQKPVTLELGGNAWVTLLDDVDPGAFSKIARRVVSGAYAYAGQSCISVQNIAIEESIWNLFQPHLEQALSECRFGDPAHAKVVCGPLIRASAKAQSENILQEALRAGATLTQSALRDGSAGDSHLLAPSLVRLPALEAGSPALKIETEEVFSPLATLRTFRRENLPALMARINQGPYGLQASVFTNQWSAIELLYRGLRVGGLVVNDVPTTRYDHQPYGGVKESGEGREGARYAMEEMSTGKFLALSSQIPG
jgi:glyceraldehyde-3-phosphate dehydrogenase (NADP+)